MRKTILGLLVGVLFSQASYATDNKAVDNFSKELGAKFDSYLKDSLKLNKVGFDVTQKKQGDEIILQAPDYTQRETVFNLTYNQKTNKISGQLLDEDQLDILNSVAKKYLSNVKTEVEVFPYKAIDKDYAVSNTSLSDLYVKPVDVAGENLATQTRLGTSLKILELSKDKKFAKVISEDDKYIAWIKRKDLIELDKPAYDNWKNSRNYIVTTDIQKPYKVFSGTMLNGVFENGKVKIKLPDNKTFTVDKSQAVSISELTKNKDKVVLNAKKRLDIGLKGKTNYLWGGSVNENIDCSGFNQSIFRLEGIMLPRDADQQQSFTKPVAVTLDKIDQLKPGDLLFFSGNRSYATHTGIYIGDYKFIHSSPKGAYRGIKINSLKGGGEYDKFLQKIYFGGGRV